MYNKNMINVRFESFYIFCISLGIVLVTIPFLILFFYFNGSFDSTITVDDLVKLTPESLDMIVNKQKMITNIGKYYLIISIICIIIGLIFCLYGFIKWKERQHIVDSIDITELQLAEKQLKDMSDEEILERKNNEIINNKKICKKKYYIKNNNKRSFENDALNLIVEKEIKVEDNYFSVLCKNNSGRYRYKKDAKIPNTNYTFDIVAESKDHSFDMIYELITWEDVPDISIVQNLFHKLYDSMEFYTYWKKIRCRCTIVVFTRKNNVNKITELLIKNMRHNIIHSRFRLAVYDINDYLKDFDNI